MKKPILSSLLLSVAFAFSACSSLPTQSDKPIANHQQKVCSSKKAEKLTGKNANMADQGILSSTNSEIIRRVTPSQPMSLDYRENRITLLVDPATNRIIRATCG